jgi:hypothetical protein
MRVELKVDADRLTLDDLIAIESGDMKAVQMRDLLARFVYADGGYVSEEAARTQIGQITLAQLRDMIAQFGKTIREEAVPKEIGSAS